VRRLQHEGDEGLRRLFDVDHVHLRARHHHIADRHLRHGQGTLDDGERIAVDEVPLVGRVEQFDELLAVLGLTQKERAEAVEQPRFMTGVVHAM